jgi:hypothetical protein
MDSFNIIRVRLRALPNNVAWFFLSGYCDIFFIPILASQTAWFAR